ncbi:MAG: hypothetical protein ACM3PP_05390 [Candidatus Saccharibacteria bacterium]
MKKSYLGLVIAFLLLIGLSFRVMSDPASTLKMFASEPEIQGPAEFIKVVKESLVFIKSKSPSHYQEICKYITEIRYDSQPPTEHVASWVEPGTGEGIIHVYSGAFDKIYMGSTLNDELKKYLLPCWLVHETRHLSQIAVYGVGAGSLEKESAALEAEKEFLVNAGAPPDMINNIAGVYQLQTRWWEQVNQAAHGQKRN